MARSKTPGLIQRGGSIWHYDILVDGIRHQGSTRTTDLKTATLFLSQLRLDIARGRLALKDTRKPLLLEEAHQEFLTYKTASASPLYITSVKAHWRVWIEPRMGKTPIDKIDCALVDQLRNDLLEVGRSKVFTNNVLITLRTLLNFAVKRGRLRKALKIELLKVQRKPRSTVPANRVQEFLAALDQATRNPQARVMVRVMLGLGMRSSEVAGMRWEWLNPEERTYTVGRAKGKEARVLPLPSWLWDALQDMPKDTLSEWIFPAETGRQHCPGFLRKPLMVAAKQLGLGNLTPHRLRASFASLHAAAGTPLSELQTMMGHKDYKTLWGYIEQTLDARRDAQEGLGKHLGFTTGESRAGSTAV
jgi:integrase